MEQVVRAAVERGRRNNLVPRRSQRGQRQRLRRLAGGRRQPRRSTFKRGHPLFKHVGGRVHDARVDVAELLQTEQPPRMVGVLKQVRRGLVDRHRARSSRRIGRLAGVYGVGSKVMLLRL